VYSGSNPVTGAYEFSRNPVWQILDVLIAPHREDSSDRWSAGLPAGDVDLGSFIDWGDYAEDTISVYDFDNSLISVERYRSDLYVKSGKRGEVLKMLLQACRGTLVAKDGKVGLVLDAPTGGTGTITGATSTVITESTRTGLVDSSWPDGGVSGLLTGLKAKILTGTGAGQVRTIASNTKTTFTVSSAFSPTPSVGGTFAIYALELNTDNVGPIQVRHKKALHELTNQVIASWESTKDQGRGATVPIPDTYEDDQSNYHFDKFGLNERTIDMPATTEWQQAVRNGWYELRRELDHNFEFVITGLNIEGLVLEVGDHVLINHDISGIANETARVVRLEDGGTATYNLTCELTRDHVYLDYPTDDFDSVDISSTLVPPHGVPPHVTGVLIDHYVELDGEQPLVVVDWDEPEWLYANWSVVVDFRYQNPKTLAWTDWTELGVSKTRKIAFRASRIGMVEVRPVLLSGMGVRADDPLDNGLSSGSNTSNTLNDTTKAWEVDEWDGCHIKIIEGAGYDADDPIREVASNTATEITVTATWDVTPNGTSVYDLYVPAPVVQEQITAGIAHGNPHLDEDDGDLFLFPGWLLGEGCKYVDSDTEPTKNDVTTTGAILTFDGLPTGGENVHTFNTDGEVRYVGIVFYTDEACTQGESGLTGLRYTYHVKNNNPRVVWFPYIPDSTLNEGVRFVATDDSDEVNFGYYTMDEGDGEPTWPGDYTVTGIVADPVDINVEVAKPDEGGTRKVILFNAVDAAGNLFRPADDPGRLFVDGNAIPNGYFNFTTEEDGTPVIIPQAIDTDCQSWRFRVNKTDVGSEVFNSIIFDDAEGTEYSGNTFNYQDLESFVLASGECLCVEGQFYRTSATDDATQEVSIPSEAMQFVIYLGSDTIVPTVKAIPSQTGSVGNLVLELNDPQDRVTGTAFQRIQGGTGLAPGDPEDPWEDLDVTGPVFDLAPTAGVTLVEGKPSTIFWGVRYSLDGGSTEFWIIGSFTYDADLLPEFSATLLQDGTTVYLSHIGDEDLLSLSYSKSVSAPVTAVDLDTPDGVVNTRTGLTSIHTTFTAGQTLYVRCRGHTQTGGAGTDSTEDMSLQLAFVDTISPTVEVIAEQVGTNGNITLTIEDPNGYVDATSMDAIDGGGIHNPGDPTTWNQYDDSDPYQLTHSTGVTISEKHNSVIFWGVRYDAGPGAVWITGSHTFDVDLLPNFSGSLSINPDGDVKFSWIGDEDTQSIQYKTAVGSIPGDVSGGSYVDTQSGQVEIYAGLAEGSELGVRVEAYNDTGGLAGSGDPSSENFTGYIGFTDTDTVIPTAKVIPSQAGSYGNITLAIEDPSGFLSATSFHTLAGGVVHNAGEPTSWDQYDNTVVYRLLHDTGVLISEKHNSAMLWGFRYDAGAGDVWVTGSHTFDFDTLPNISPSLTLVGTQGRLAWTGDEDTACVEYKASTSVITDWTSSSYSDNRQDIVNAGSALADGETLYVWARGWSGAGKTGSESAETWEGEIQYNAGGTGDDLAPLGIVVFGEWVPHVTSTSTHKVLLNIQVGAAVESMEFTVVGVGAEYSYTINTSADYSDYLKATGGSPDQTFEMTDGDPIIIEVQPFSAVDKGGDAGAHRFFDMLPPANSGAGVAVVAQDSTEIGGRVMELAPMFEVTEATSYNPELGVPTTHDLGSLSGTVVPDFADGPVQKLIITTTTHLDPPTNMPDGATFHIRVQGGSGDTLTLDDLWLCPYGQGPWTPYSSGDLIISAVKIGGDLYTGIMFHVP